MKTTSQNFGRRWQKAGALWLPGAMPNPGFIAGVIKPAGGGGGGVNYSDDFNRANDTNIGADYTKLAGSAWQIFSNQLADGSGGFTWLGTVANAKPTNTVNQYGKIVVNQDGIATAGFIFRYTNSSSPFYVVWIDDNANEIRWRHWTAVGGTVTTVGSTSYTPSYPLTFGVTLVGTGNSTEVKVWISPSGLPTGWPAADYTLTDNPASPVDTGTIMGIAAESNSTTLIDEWYWGDAP